MLTENLQIYIDAKELARILLVYQPNVARIVRYGEYGRALSMTCEAMDLIYVANSNADTRTETIVRLLQIMGGIKSRICLLAETQYLSPKQAVNLTSVAEKIIRQATGWRNASQRQSHKATAI